MTIEKHFDPDLTSLTISEPTLLLNKDICQANISKMVAKAQKNNLIFRPHFKTHQSHEIGRWFREVGVEKITVSSLRMAEYFVEDGWTDITVAFPVNILEIERIKRLSSSIHLNLLVESKTSAEFLKDNITSPLSIFIKVDVGYHRTGLAPDHTGQIDDILHTIKKSDHLDFKGFLAHAGHSYAARGIEEIRTVHEESLVHLRELRERYNAEYENLIISSGDTPTCSTMDDFEGIDEIRPGNFVFYDLTQHTIGSCSLSDIAVALAAPVVAKHADRMELIVYAGGVHLSKDRLERDSGQISFGKPVELEGTHWKLAFDDANYVSKLSQEHGTVKVTRKVFEKYNIGDLIGILPVHSCLTANLMKQYRTATGVISRL